MFQRDAGWNEDVVRVRLKCSREEIIPTEGFGRECRVRRRGGKPARIERIGRHGGSDDETERREAERGAMRCGAKQKAAPDGRPASQSRMKVRLSSTRRGQPAGANCG